MDPPHPEGTNGGGGSSPALGAGPAPLGSLSVATKSSPAGPSGQSSSGSSSSSSSAQEGGQQQGWSGAKVRMNDLE